MRRTHLISGAMLALLARADVPRADMPTPTRMKTGETPNEICAAFDVYLDGVRQDGCCVEADTQAGYVVRYRRSQRTGKYVRNGDEIETERVEGKVEFKRRVGLG